MEVQPHWLGILRVVAPNKAGECSDWEAHLKHLAEEIVQVDRQRYVM